MNEWQTAYLDSLEELRDLRGRMGQGEETEDGLREKLTALSRRNTLLLRERLFPVLDNVLALTEEDTAQLQAFAQGLQKLEDYGLCLHIHKTLLVRARRTHDRDLLIRELYECGMGLYNQGVSVRDFQSEAYVKRMRLYFQEAASYLRVYDDIASEETRGYIHRSMGNIALGYHGEKENMQKLQAINQSLRVLSDPEFHQKSPHLPWQAMLMKTHQERTSLLHCLRGQNATQEVASQVMESALLIQNAQREKARQEGHPLAPRWQYAYQSALYYSGIITLEQCVSALEKIAADTPEDDYTYQGSFANVSIAAYISAMVSSQPPEVIEEKYAARLDKLYQRALRYIRRASGGQVSSLTMARSLSQLVGGLLETEGGFKARDLLMELTALWSPMLHLHMCRISRLAEQLVRLAAEEEPELLVGLPGCDTPGQVREQKEALADWAAQAGMLCRIGLLYLPSLYTLPARSLLQEELELYETYPYIGSKILGEHPSTRALAQTALGHMRAWQGEGGYPASYDRRADTAAPITDAVAVAVALEDARGGHCGSLQSVKSPEEAIRDVLAQAGTHLNPSFAALAKKLQTI